MNTVKTLVTFLACLICFSIDAQSEKNNPDLDQITETLNNYFNGTSNGQPELLLEAFHPDFNLYAVDDNDSLLVRSGQEYMALFEPGEKNNRIGKIISIDFVKDIAVAKAEVLIPNWRKYTDYFMLVRYEGSWKIVQKSYTWEAIKQ